MIDLRSIAPIFNLSASRFRHLFKQVMGVSPHNYQRTIQLSTAKNLLETSFLRIKEVTALVGAKDMSHFIRACKRTYKLTPSQTRAKHLGRSRILEKIAIFAKE